MSSTDRLSAALIATARQSSNTTNLGSERASFFPTTFDKFPQTSRLNTIGVGGAVRSITVAGSFAISSALGSYSALS